MSSNDRKISQSSLILLAGLITTIVFFVGAGSALAETYTAPGAYTYTVGNSSQLYVQMAGGGGGGGGWGCSVNYMCAFYSPPGTKGGAGGVGGYTSFYLTVSPGQQITLYVGGGGAAGNFSYNGGSGGGGGSSYFGGYVAGGGGGGGGAVSMDYHYTGSGGGGGGGTGAGESAPGATSGYLGASGGYGYGSGGAGALQWPWPITYGVPVRGGVGSTYGGNGGQSASFTTATDYSSCAMWGETGCDAYNSITTYVPGAPGSVGSANGGSVVPGGGSAGGAGGQGYYGPNSTSGGNGYVIITASPINACYPAADPATYGNSCTSAANACGQTNTGTIQCNGSCSSTVPSNTLCPPPTVSCSGSPGTPWVGQPVTWSSSVSGGSGSYSYVWSSTSDADLFETTPSFKKAYTTPGQKNASLSVTDSQSGKTGSATCTNSETGGVGISVKSCTSSLSVSPDTVEQGQNTTLSWSVSGGGACASSCSGSGFNTGGAISGTADASVPPSPPTTTYSLTCTRGTYGPPAPANTTVTVLVPTADITANNQSTSARVNPKIADNTIVAWSSEHVASCTVMKNGVAWQNGLSSTSTPDTVTTQTTYAIDCVNHYGVHSINTNSNSGTNSTGKSSSVIVNILPGFNEF